MNHRQIGIVVSDAPPKAKVAGRGKKYFPIDPILLLLFETLIRTPSTLGTFVGQTRELVPFIGFAGNREAEHIHWTIFNDDRVAAVGELDQARRPVAVFIRHSPAPSLG